MTLPEAAIAQLGERETEDLKVPSSILGLGRHCSSSESAAILCGAPHHDAHVHPRCRAAPPASNASRGRGGRGEGGTQIHIDKAYGGLHLARIELATFSVLG